MKICMTMLLLAAIGGGAQAQGAHTVFVIHPYITRGDMRESRFWRASTVVLVAVDGAAKAADSFATRENIDGGGAEYNPLARPFVHTPAVQVSTMAALLGAEVAAAYWLHRRGHDYAGKGILAGGAMMNGLGAASSFKHRVAGW